MRLLTIAALAAGSALSACRTAARDDAPDVLEAERTPAAALAALRAANAAYADHAPRAVMAERAGLAAHQEPPVAVVACADSRSAPEWVFEQRPGRLFVVREAGNVPRSGAVASVEYAVAHLGTVLVVVLGHDRCGAVSAAASGGDPGTPALRELVAAIAPAVEAVRGRADGGDVVAAAVAENARRGAAALRESSDLLRRAVAEGRLRIVAGVHDLDTGRVAFLDE